MWSNVCETSFLTSARRMQRRITRMASRIIVGANGRYIVQISRDETPVPSYPSEFDTSIHPLHRSAVLDWGVENALFLLEQVYRNSPDRVYVQYK